MNCARNFLFSFCFGSSIFCRYFLFAGPGFKYSNPAAAVQPRPQHKSTSSCKHRAPAAVRGARTRGGLEHPGRRRLVCAGRLGDAALGSRQLDVDSRLACQLLWPEVQRRGLILLLLLLLLLAAVAITAAGIAVRRSAAGEADGLADLQLAAGAAAARAAAALRRR